MKRLDSTGSISVFDSEGAPGSASAEALRMAEAQILIRFGDGQAVQVPHALLHRREDGSYYLPLSLRELQDGTVTLGEISGHTAASSAEDQGDQGEVMAVIPVVAEEARITKREIETGRVRIRKTVQSDEQVVDVPLLRDQVHVERVPVGRYLEQPLEARYEGDTLVIPVMEEVLVVQKRLRLREEIRVTTVRERVRYQESVTLQREQLTIARDEPR